WRTRRRLGLWDVPLPFVLAAVFCSTPVIFALERGNCDILVLLLIILAAAALRGSSVYRDLAVGACLGLAIWLKVYPAMLVLGLLALRRPRAVICVGLAYTAIGLADLPDLPHYWQNTRAYIKAYDIAIHWTAHPLGTCWKRLWEGTSLAPFARIPGTVAAGCAIVPLMLWVSYHLFRCRERTGLVYPYFC